MKIIAFALLVLLASACNTVKQKDEVRASPHFGLILLCESDEVMAVVEGEPKYWRDTQQCVEAREYMNWQR